MAAMIAAKSLTLEKALKFTVKLKPKAEAKVFHPLDVLPRALDVAKSGHDNLPWLRTQSEGCSTSMLSDLMIVKPFLSSYTWLPSRSCPGKDFRIRKGMLQWESGKSGAIPCGTFRDSGLIRQEQTDVFMVIQVYQATPR